MSVKTILRKNKRQRKLKSNQEWAIQRYRQLWAQDTERRQATKQIRTDN